MRLKVLSLSEEAECGAGPVGGAVAGAGPAPLSTVFWRGSRSRVSFSPMDAWRNHGSEILRRSGLGGLWPGPVPGCVVAITVTASLVPSSRSHITSGTQDRGLTTVTFHGV